MPKGPPVHEIFNPPTPGNKTTPSFNYEKKESKTQLTPKKTLAPLPPMTKFGGYKPKILGGGLNEDIAPINSHKTTRPPDPPAAGVENKKRLPIQLTQPKPFIIGDKNTPMVLSTVDHDNSDSDSTSDDLQNGIEEIHIYEEPPMYMASGDSNIAEMNNNSNNNNNDLNNNIYNTNIVPDNYGGGMVNNKPYYHMEENFERPNSTFHHPHPMTNHGGGFIVPNEHDDLITQNHTTDPTAFATENPAFHNTDTLPLRSDADDGHNDDSRNEVVEHESEPDGVFIPAPDYDEEERVMEFDEEDPDEMAEEEKRVEAQRLQRLKELKEQQNGTRMKVYDGEDLSKYLSDDEDDFYMDSANSSKTMPARLNQKHSLFKTTPQHPTMSKRKNANKKNAQKFNSVRNFSLADSKYATAGKVGGKKMMVTGGEGGGGGGRRGGGGAFDGDSGDYESFLSTSQQGEGYETFLVSKHGVGGDSPSSGHPGYRPSHHSNGKAGDGIWKKLTVRLKNKKQKNGYDMQEQF